MRKNTEVAFNAWREGKAKVAADAIHTNGETITSYGTLLLWRYRGVLALNMTRYSVTTTRQQHGLRYLLARYGIPFVEVTGLPFAWQDSPEWTATADAAVLAAPYANSYAHA